MADDEVNLEWKGEPGRRADRARRPRLARGKAAASLADADRAVVQGLVAIAASPESAVWIMLVAEARFLRARAVRALAPRRARRSATTPRRTSPPPTSCSIV
ncbi:MAG: hypothetical protein IPL61_18690 [Myxococcales bacterium]|nr:hypothetical protein [Myxococcales bacterium]